MRTAVYLRQSLDQHKTGLAIDRQRKACLELCASKGWEAVEYVDNSVSATSGKRRPAYRQMLADIESGSVEGVVVWDLDRLHRRPAELEEFIDIADSRKLKLATVTGDVDLSTHNGRLYARIKGAVGRAEMEQKSARQQAAQAQRRESGRGWTTRRPFGFEQDGVGHHSTEARIVRRLYNDALAGVSQSQMAKDLNTLGITSTLGNPWSQAAIRNLLLNPRNAGFVTHRGEIVGKAVWEPIVDEDLFHAVSRSLRANAQRGGGALKYPLVGLASCGVCGAKIKTMQTTRGVKMYCCSAKSCVGRNQVRLDEFITSLVVGRLSRDDAQTLLVHANAADGDLGGKAKSLRARLDRVAEDEANDVITRSQMLTQTKALRARLAAVEAQMGQAVQGSLLEPLVASHDVTEAWSLLDPVRQRQVIDTLMAVTINRTTKGSRFNSRDIAISWKR